MSDPIKHPIEIMNNNTMSHAISIFHSVETNSTIIRIDESNALTEASMIANRSKCVRLQRIWICSIIFALLPSLVFRRSAHRILARPITCTRRFVIVRRSSPIPEINMAGPIAVWRIGMSCDTDVKCKIVFLNDAWPWWFYLSLIKIKSIINLTP